jgi:radical SAM superfamily enzyme YgiQ (UPF0313 family)
VYVVLISTYELGHAPFGLASPKAWLVRDGHSVRAVDLAVERLPEPDIQKADLVAFYLPMHTATRLALPVIERVKRLNPGARLAAYGLYAPLNADLLRGLGVEAIAGGEFEGALAKLARGETVGEISLDRLEFLTPDRSDIDGGYARLHHLGRSKQVAYTEASRGCKHLCRHCPIVPVYRGQFRVVQRDVVLADIRQQIAAGAQHVTFGDPDFFNGPTHAARIVEALHAEFPDVTYDATIKVEHLLKHRDLLGVLRETGCVLITSAVESVDDSVLAKLEKNHTRADFLEAVRLTREAGLALQPTFIAFMPWTTIEGYRELLRVIRELDLVENVAPVQLALRLLITTSSRLLELPEVRASIGPFDPKSLVYPWKHADPEVDTLARRVFRLVHEKQDRSRAEIFAEICTLAGMSLENFDLVPRAAIPYLDEPWYC